MTASSSGVKGPPFTEGASWLSHRRRHDLPLRPGMLSAMRVQFRGPCTATWPFSTSSSCNSNDGIEHQYGHDWCQVAVQVLAIWLIPDVQSQEWRFGRLLVAGVCPGVAAGNTREELHAVRAHLLSPWPFGFIIPPFHTSSCCRSKGYGVHAELHAAGSSSNLCLRRSMWIESKENKHVVICMLVKQAKSARRKRDFHTAFSRQETERCPGMERPVDHRACQLFSLLQARRLPVRRLSFLRVSTTRTATSQIIFQHLLCSQGTNPYSCPVYLHHFVAAPGTTARRWASHPPTQDWRACPRQALEQLSYLIRCGPLATKELQSAAQAPYQRSVGSSSVPVTSVSTLIPTATRKSGTRSFSWFAVNRTGVVRCDVTANLLNLSLATRLHPFPGRDSYKYSA